MYRGWSRKAIYAGTVIVTLCIVGGFAVASVSPSTFGQIGQQNTITNPKGISMYGADFGTAFETLPSAGFVYVICNSAACGPHSEDILALNGAAVGDLVAEAFINFSASGGVPAQEYYALQIGVAGVGSFFISVETPTVASGHWTSTVDDFLIVWCDLGTLTTTAMTINVILSDYGHY